MDFELVFWIILLAFYLLIQVFGKKKKKPTPGTLPPPPGTAPEAAGTDEFQDALRELRQALGAPPPPPPQPKPAETGFDHVYDFHEDFGRPEAAFEQRTMLPSATATSEDRFEARPAFSEPFPTRPRLPTPKPDPIKTLLERPVTLRRSRRGFAGIRKKLRNADAAREAFLFYEILHKPRSQRPPGR